LKQTATNFCWMCSSLLASIDVIEFQTTEACSSLDVTRVKYNMYIYSMDEEMKVTL
jgi:hypothetical protein